MFEVCQRINGRNTGNLSVYEKIAFIGGGANLCEAMETGVVTASSSQKSLMEDHSTGIARKTQLKKSKIEPPRPRSEMRISNDFGRGTRTVSSISLCPR